MKYIYILLIISGLSLLSFVESSAQVGKVPVEEMTREQIMDLSMDDLLELSMEDLLLLSQKMGISIDELLAMKTTVASRSELTPRETPGIISVITADEISHSGARDIMDVLYLVPGINFTWDADGVVGIQMRGNWAFEGKVSILIDGQEVNDLKYLIVPFGHHFSVDQVQRIEVIRGPGSSIYGGTAELGVINIITKSGADIRGAEVIVSYGAFIDGPGTTRATINMGDKRNDFMYSLSGSLIDGNRSNRTYHIDSAIYANLADTGAHLNNKNLNLGFAYKDLSVKFIYDDYLTEYFWENYIYPNQFKTWLGEVKYQWKLGDNLVLTPKYNFRRSIPYYEEGYSGNLDIYRNEFGISGNYSLKGGSNIIAGVSYYNDLATSMYQDADSYIYFDDDSTYQLPFSNLSAFAQAFIKAGEFNFIAGGRVDWHSEYGAAFAPRLGLTRVDENLHFKLLLSRAFRSPSFGNIIFEPAIKPEYTWVIETESGYKINNNMFITCNLFYSRIENSIVWYDSTEYDEDSYGYTNAGITGTYGMELEYRAVYSKGTARLNYSFYDCRGLNEIDSYIDPENSSMMMGSPKHKITLSGNYNITKNSWLSPSLIYWSGAHSYAGYDSDEVDQGDLWFKPVAMLNFFYTINIRSFELSAGVKDMFNSRKYYIQGYAGGEVPFPAASSELILKVTYKFNFKRN